MPTATAMLSTNTNQNSDPPPPPGLKRKYGEVSPSSGNDSVKQQKMLDQQKDSGFTQNMYKAYVHDVLGEVEKQNPEPLNTLSSKIALPSSSTEAHTTQQLQYIISALTSEITRLDTQNSSVIISAVLKLKWSHRTVDFVSAYSKFLGVLVSGIPKWWSDVANKMVSEFVYEHTEPQHSVLRYILWLTPTASSSVKEILEKNFPHKSDSTKAHVRYINNILKTVEYCPELQYSVWDLILNRTVQLDLELYEEIDEEDDEEGEEEDDEEEEEEEDVEVLDIADHEGSNKIKDHTLQHRLEADDDDEGGDNDDESDAGSDTSEYLDETVTNFVSVRKKLDAIVTTIFNHLETKFTTQALVSGSATPLFKMLLDIFKKNILSTHRTRSVQYIFFKICHCHHDLLDAFLSYLIGIALDPTADIGLRQKSMQYISSFIARAKGLSRQLIVFVVQYLAQWLERYIQEREVEVDGAVGGMSRFKMFYSVSQALFYIFCFRHAVLKKEDNPSEWECGIDKLFQRLIVTKFNPLRYCKRTVVAMFARIAQKEDVVYCFSIMEQNRLGGFRSTSPTNNNTQSALANSNFGASSNNWNPNEPAALEGYFPFDPLVLPNARKQIKDFYVEWDDVAEDFDSGSESVDEDEDEEEDDGDNGEEDDDEDVTSP